MHSSLARELVFCALQRSNVDEADACREKGNFYDMRAFDARLYMVKDKPSLSNEMRASDTRIYLV